MNSPRRLLRDLPRPSTALQQLSADTPVDLSLTAEYRRRVVTRSFACFASGDVGRGGVQFRGRPLLAREFFSVTRDDLARGVVASFVTGQTFTVLRHFWKHLDAMHTTAPVASAGDLTEIHLTSWLRAGVDAVHYRACIRLIRIAREHASLPRIYVPSVEARSSKASVVPESWIVRAVYHELKRLVRSIQDRWEKARQSGTELAPQKCDVQPFLWLFVVQTGWNPSTALDLNVADGAWLCSHPLSESLKIVKAFKERAGVDQSAVSMVKPLTSPHNLIEALLRQTTNIRDRARVELRALEAQSRALDEPERARLRLIVESPWIYAPHYNKRPIAGVLDRRTYASTAAGGSPWRAFLHQLNVARSMRGEGPIPTALQLSDFRDAFISFAYRASGYQWLIARLAAGHTSMSSVQPYLNHLQWKVDGMARVRALQRALMSQLGMGVVDAATLRVMVERGSTSEEQARRWLAMRDRTRVGMGCTTFESPPRTISPTHRAGRGCRVQRCAMCPSGLVFPDSEHLLARRVAELHWTRERIPLPAWISSSFPFELSRCLELLSGFDKDIVEMSIQEWSELIQKGLHLPPTLEGSYE